MRKKTVLLGVTGSIACYKAADLTSRLTQSGFNVQVVMTRHATEFVSPLTFQTLSRNPVTIGIFDEKESWHPGHIALADGADLLLIAPATANVIAKIACGIADDALTSIALASLAPLLIAPAMNEKMWLHAATQENVARLKSRGALFIGPQAGPLACGYEGIGRLWDIHGILAEVQKILPSE
jgi:phosphopantothenoylcysteine decarboxylase/phosphopantothenate--cysteine ligase